MILLNMTDEVKCNFPFFQAPNNIFKQNLKTVEIVTYLYLCRCGNNRGTAFPSYQNIADNCKIGKRTAIDAVRSLQEKGLLLKIVRPKDDKDNYTNIYEVAIPKSIPGATDAPPSAGHALPPGATDAPPSATDAPNKETHYKEPPFYKEQYILFVEWFNQEFGRKYKSSIYKDKINTRLKTFTLDQLKQASMGMKANKHMMGENDNKKVYATVEYIVRNDANVEKWLTDNTATEDNKYGFLNLGKFNKCNDIELPDDLPDM